MPNPQKNIVASRVECERDEPERAPNPIDALFTATQRRLLGFLFGQTDRAYAIQELLALTGAGDGATRRELWRLQEAGVIKTTSRRRRYYVQADRRCPLHAELAAMFRKTVGLAEPLRAAFATLAWRVQLAFVEVPHSGVPADRTRALQLVLVADPGELPVEVIDYGIELAEHLLACPLDFPLIRAPADLRNPDPRLEYLLRQTRVWVFGGERRLAEMQGDCQGFNATTPN